MKKALNGLIFFLLLANLCSAQKKEEKAVLDVFENYKTAILNDKGEEAVQLVDSRTVRYYSEILEKVKSADSATVNSFSLLDKLMVFILRHRATKEELKSFDGKGLLVYAIKMGMVGKNGVANASIGDVAIDGDFAKGQFMVNGQKSPFHFDFYKEEGQWKIDLTSLFSVSEMGLKKMVEDSGQSENDYLFMLLELSTGKKPGPEIWKTI